jgi:hypothetical protein
LIYTKCWLTFQFPPADTGQQAGDRGVGLNVMSEYEYAWRRINVLGVPTGSTVTVASCLWARKIILSFLLFTVFVLCCLLYPASRAAIIPSERETFVF